MRIALTDKALSALKSKPARYEIQDTYCPGLSVRVTPEGRKTFNIKYRYGIAQKRMSLGVYPRMSLVDARAKAMEVERSIETRYIGHECMVMNCRDFRVPQGNEAKIRGRYGSALIQLYNKLFDAKTARSEVLADLLPIVGNELGYMILRDRIDDCQFSPPVGHLRNAVSLWTSLGIVRVIL